MHPAPLEDNLLLLESPEPPVHLHHRTSSCRIRLMFGVVDEPFCPDPFYTFARAVQGNTLGRNSYAVWT